MREDLTRFGVEETRTPEELDDVIRKTKGTVMVVVNSVCGCAAGLARPAIGMALQHSTKPDKVVTVFAGADVAATDRARSYLKVTFHLRPQSESCRMAVSSICWNAIKLRAATHMQLQRT
jgi:putative YphP/YqiW family bacilliredoxin